MQYVSKKVGDSRIVWLNHVNRYIVFQKPAFDVFECLANHKKEEETANWFSQTYHAGGEESLLFVREINAKIKQLEANNPPQYPNRDKIDTIGLNVPKSITSKTYLIQGKRIRFSYSNPCLTDMVHPHLAHLQTKTTAKANSHFYLFQTADELILKINEDKFFRWPVAKPEYFKASVSLQLMNFLHGLKDEDWMGAFHAAAVSKNNNAILISAPSGFGKSTLSALLVSGGLNLISDDLVPISRKHQQIFPFPAGISVKPGAIDMLSEKFTELKNAKIRLDKSTGKEGTYLVPPFEPGLTPATVKAIIFPEFNKNIDFEWEKADNISVLNDFISESWIASDETAVRTFLDWFFQLPCYRIRYSNNKKAVQKIQKLFHSFSSGLRVPC